jgi:hypothetical protein
MSKDTIASTRAKKSAPPGGIHSPAARKKAGIVPTALKMRFAGAETLNLVNQHPAPAPFIFRHSPFLPAISG